MTTFESRHVFYSRTVDNPFLPDSYLAQLRRDLDPMMARRMLDGEWIDLHVEKIYYAYTAKNFINQSYDIDTKYPIILSYDFNIALGKPLSAVLMQFIDDTLHIFGEVVVEGMRTLDSLDEVADRGIFDLGAKVYVHGDASGKNRDTRNVKSDYDQIKQFLNNYRSKKAGKTLEFEMVVPLSNPPVRKRWALVNAYAENDEGQNRMYVYKDAPTADKGLRLTTLKSGGRTTEDDSKPYQHITTAIGYGLFAQKYLTRGSQSRTIRL